MNPLFESFRDVIGGDEDDIIRPIEDHYPSISFSPMSLDELMNLSLPDKNLAAINITFTSPLGNKYSATHVNKDDGSHYILLRGPIMDHNDFIEVEAFIAQAVRGKPGTRYGHFDDISNVINLCHPITRTKAVDWINRAYTSLFRDIHIEGVHYHNVPVDDFLIEGVKGKNITLSEVQRPHLKKEKRLALEILCRDHAKLATNNIQESNIVAIHPYHHELESHESEDAEFNESEQPTPVLTLQHLLVHCDLSRFGIILFDSYDHYAQKSHELVDQGRISSVIFTHPYQGKPIDRRQLTVLRGTRRNYYGGTYGQQCVKQAIWHINLFCLFPGLRPINDAILWSDKVEIKIRGFEVGDYRPYQLSLIERFTARRGAYSQDLLWNAK